MPPEDKPTSNDFLRTLNLAKPFWPWLLGLSTSIILASFVRQVPPQIQKALIDLITKSAPPQIFGLSFNFTSLLGAFFSVVISLALFNRLTRALSNRFDVRFRFHLRQLAYRQLLDLSITYYNKNNSGSLMSKIERGAAQVSSAINNLSSNIAPSVVSAILSIIIVTSIRWEITLFVLLGFAIYFPIRRLRFKHVEKIDKRIHQLWDKYNGHFYEAISSIRLVKSFASENYEFRLYQRFAKKVTKFNDTLDNTETKFLFADIFLNLWLGCIFAYVFYLGLNHSISIGTVVLLIQYTDIIRQPFTSLEWTFWEIKRAQIGARDYMKILDATDYSYQSPNPILAPRLRGQIEFQNVSFHYPEKGGQDVFNKLNFKIEPGQTLAIVGKSGAGKTTLAHLLIRFFDADSGKILVDGHDIKEISLSDLRKNVGLVMQSSYLFADSITENLRYGKPNASLKEMKIACQVANATEFIDRFPLKYKTKIGERGVKLSGGQQQRLSIARTVLKNPPILILDEATSALDSHSEMLVQDALSKLIKGRTTIIIAHRLSTVQKADNIIVLGKKKILEQGTHQQLIKKKKGIYASLHEIQSGKTQTLKEYELV